MGDFPEFTYLTPGTTSGIKFDTTVARDIATGDGNWVVVGLSGKASYSDDGINWTVLTPGTDSGIKFGNTSIFAIGYGGGRFVAVGEQTQISYSTDGGETWSTANTNYSFMVPDDMGKGECDFFDMFVAPQLNDIAFGTDGAGNPRLIAVGIFGGATYSDNGGETWTLIDPGCEDFGQAGTEGLKFLHSGDFFDPGNNVEGIAFGKDDDDNDLWIVVGERGKASYSGDGLNWTILTAGTNTGIKFGTLTTANSIAYGEDGNNNGRWVVVGNSGRASYSDDGKNWTELTAGTETGIKFGTSHANKVAYGNGYWIVVGASGKASYSEDGVNWNVLTAGETTGIKFDTTGAFGLAISENPKCVVVGDSGKASYSLMGDPPAPAFDFKKVGGVDVDNIARVGLINIDDIKKIGGV